MEISRNKVLISSGAVGLLGILITVFSVYHSQHMGGSFFQFPLFLYGTAILSLVVGGFIVLLFQEKINKYQLKRVLSVLPQNEAKVMEILIERKEIEQNKLATISELSNVKVSRIISILEHRGIIGKKKHGYTNLILLKI